MTGRIPDEWILRIIGIRRFLESGYPERIFSRFLVARLRRGMALSDLVSIECRLAVLPEDRREAFQRLFFRIAGVSLARKLHDIGFEWESKEVLENTREAEAKGGEILSGLESDWICEQAGDAEALERLTLAGEDDVFESSMMDEQIFDCRSGRL